LIASSAASYAAANSGDSSTFCSDWSSAVENATPISPDPFAA